MKMKSMMLSGAFATMVLASPTLAEPVRLGVLTDMSGMNFDLAGDGSSRLRWLWRISGVS